MFALIVLAAPWLFGAVLGALFGRSGWRLLALVVLGVLLGFCLLLWAYLVAPPNYSQSNGCSDCEEYLGRWWEPNFVLVLAVLGNAAYLVGVGIGAAVGAILRAARKPRPTV